MWAWKEPGFFRAKLFLNLLSTGAHVLAGKVYGNRMVDVRISNSKLFERALRIVEDISGAGREKALEALVGAVHGTDRPPRELLEAPPEVHVRAAASRERVVPLAVLVAARGLSLDRARALLEEKPILREALEAT